MFLFLRGGSQNSKESSKVLLFERESSSIWMRTNCYLPRGLSSASDWLPGYEHQTSCAGASALTNQKLEFQSRSAMEF